MEQTPPPATPDAPAAIARVLASVNDRIENLRLEVVHDRETREAQLRATQERIDVKNRLYRRATLALGIAVTCAAAGIVVLFWQLDQARDQRAQIRQIVETQVAAANQREIDQCV